MIVKSEETLDRYRGTLRCELCGMVRVCSPHHIFGRGMGGGTRLDVDENLIATCLFCHSDVHAGVIGRGEVLQAVSRRMHMTPAEVEQKVWDLRRAPK